MHPYIIKSLADAHVMELRRHAAPPRVARVARRPRRRARHHASLA